jgi:hypothetical protein
MKTALQPWAQRIKYLSDLLDCNLGSEDDLGELMVLLYLHDGIEREMLDDYFRGRNYDVIRDFATIYAEVRLMHLSMEKLDDDERA